MKNSKSTITEKIPKNKSGSESAKLRTIVGYLLAVVFLVWVFHDVRLAEFWSRLGAIRWPWVAAGVAFDIAGYISMGVRWSLLLRPLAKVSSARTTQAIYAGLFINEILPLRVGELARMYLVSRWAGKDFLSVVPSVALQRLFEGIWLVAGIGLIAIFVPLPKDFLAAGDIFGVLLLLATALFVILILRKPKHSPAQNTPKMGSRWRLIARARKLLGKLLAGLRAIGLTRSIYAAFFLTLLMFAFMALAFWTIMRAYGIALSFWAGAAVYLIVHFGTALPNAPANVGSYQFFCVLGLSLFGVAKTLATGFSVVVFLILTIPLWLIGSIALARSGTSLSLIKSQLKELKNRGDAIP